MTEIRHETRDDDMVAWRHHRLLRCGFPAGLAGTLAADCAMDLHALLGLVDRGCPPELAARILAPLDAGRRPCHPSGAPPGAGASVDVARRP